MNIKAESIVHNRENCPSPETLLQFQRTALSRKKEETIRRHIILCDACARDSLLIAKTLGKEKSIVHEAERKYVRELWHGAFALRYIAAGLIIIIAGIIAFDNFKDRAIVDEHQLRTLKPTIIEPVQVLNVANSLIFRWTKVPKTDFYVVELFGDSLELVWESGKIHEESLSLPEYINRKLKRGKHCAWMVTAYLADGRTIKSKLGEFQIQ
jgi:hypothetical protein